MQQELYCLVLERLLKEFSTMSGGSVSGVSVPLGADATGEVKYAKPEATDKKHRKDKKSNANRKGSIQHTLKHG